jgi:hypothetical protein
VMRKWTLVSVATELLKEIPVAFSWLVSDLTITNLLMLDGRKVLSDTDVSIIGPFAYK